MQFLKVFFTNISLLITLAFLINLGYKYVFKYFTFSKPINSRMKTVALFAVLVFAGWLTMMFGLRINETIIYDLRYMPLIIGIFLFTKPFPLFMVGLGIGLARFAFGINEAAIAGFYNMILLGVTAAVLKAWFRKTSSSQISQMIAAALIINVQSAIHSLVWGVIPFWTSLTTILPITLPLGLMLSGFFLFILRDFYLELKRTEELENTNALLREQTKELQLAKAALEEKARQVVMASQIKSEFLANMSHELKTPLNGIILLSQLLGDQHEGRFTEEELEYLGIIHTSGEELLRQINDILDLSKVEAGKMEIYKEEVSVQEIPQILQHQFHWVAEQKAIEFQIRMGDNLPDLIETDGMRVHQIIKNLLSNAFKFTSKGQVTLEIRRAAEGFDGRLGEWIAFAVSDTGIGVAQEKHRLIFEAFRQADGSISRKYGGTGLGLSISLELTKLLGGHLTLASHEGKGSTFTLYLPVD
ncbi:MULTISPECIES: ATP-binding protein [unclassified Paenibacillus]|uniref:ATP-binding protein n=1 Tax=unclassified Paenibacillus TaxID=185978 RepID=UPI001AE8B15B|nr:MULTISPECIES: ATP-binding protein [unclassified Paenibacillus]MBP1157594.1 two-component system chemotaxis sensor kinase CheA [Paenibacillus sp. PvP091]MBP1171669.1 two-component system chemotaxis sensor kinase CheA [Paenibacillus sp. PvR098]MBP2438050.1 two-component system chemotaxis sensor kinase CheA [Paenibacillus sp. PvP052]